MKHHKKNLYTTVFLFLNINNLFPHRIPVTLYLGMVIKWYIYFLKQNVESVKRQTDLVSLGIKTFIGGYFMSRPCCSLLNVYQNSGIDNKLKVRKKTENNIKWLGYKKENNKNKTGRAFFQTPDMFKKKMERGKRATKAIFGLDVLKKDEEGRRLQRRHLD